MASLGSRGWRGGEHPSRAVLSAYVDGEVDAAVRAQIDRHLPVCEHCRAVVEEYRHASDFFRRVPARRPPTSLNRDVWRRIAEIDARRGRPFSWLGRPGPAGAAPLNLLGIGVTAILLLALLPQLVALWGAFAGHTERAAPVAVSPPATARPTESPLATPAIDLATATVAAPAAPGEPAAEAARGGAPPAGSPPAPRATAANDTTAPPAPVATGGAVSPGAATKSATPAASAAASRPAPPPSPTPTAVPVMLRTIAGTVTAMDRRQRQLIVTAGAVAAAASPPATGAPAMAAPSPAAVGAQDGAAAWIVGLAETTAFSYVDGRKLSVEDIGIGDQVEVTGFVQSRPAAPSATPPGQVAGFLAASSLRVLVSAAPQTIAAGQQPRVLVLLDGVESMRTPQYGFTGDWIKRLTATGYAVTAVEPARISSGSVRLNDFTLIVIGYPATLSESALQAIRQSKLPILDADPRLVQPLGLGLNVDPAQPTRSSSGKTIEIAGQAGPITRGFSGETVVANETLYRTPIVASGTVLAWVSDGSRRYAVWSITGSTMYFGFWWSNTGQNHNAAYWTLFDRSVAVLLGRTPS